MGQSDFDQGFYEVTAQVIPVLLIVMSIGEFRLRKSKREPLWVIYANFFLLFLVLAGEIAALAALARQTSSREINFLVASSIGIGLSYIFFRFSEQTSKETREMHPKAKTRLLVPLALLGPELIMTAALLFMNPR